jgi:glutamate-1-semialdehyde 2,1-aminomutase
MAAAAWDIAGAGGVTGGVELHEAVRLVPSAVNLGDAIGTGVRQPHVRAVGGRRAREQQAKAVRPWLGRVLTADPAGTAASEEGMMATLTSRAAAVLERYQARTPRSAALYERARESLPAGTTRSLNSWRPYPTYIEAGHGVEVRDVDGNRYLDFLNNYSSLIHGHAHPAVMQAIADRLPDGTIFSFAGPLEVQLAEAIRARVPSIERLRFTNSGLEATMFAIKAARAFSGRELVAKFEGGYHGTHDGVLVSIRPPLDQAGPREAPNAVADAEGVARSAVGDVVVLPYNDLAATARILHAQRDRLAALIVEPVLGSGGVVPPRAGFLQGLRDLTRDLGILLIFDEIITFRLARGGAQERFGVSPDLTCLGKVIGGGLPVGAYGGRADIMALFEPRGGADAFDARQGGPRIYQGGTFTGNPLTASAGLATLELLTPAAFAHLDALGDRLQMGLKAVFEELDAPAQVSGVGSLWNIHFTPTPISDGRDPREADAELAHLFFLELLNRGLLIAPRGMIALSTPTTLEQVDHFVAETRAALTDLLGRG